MDFYGTTERIFIGHDQGVTRIDFDGTNETFIGTLSSYTANVPRPLKQFLGNLYFGNGENIGEIVAGATVADYTRLSPGFPSGTQVRDLDIVPDGGYLEIVVNRLALSSIIATTPDTANIANMDSYVFKWNGTDTGYTSYITFPSYSLTANIAFGQYKFLFGYDMTGHVVYFGDQKILTPLFTQAPLPNAVGSNGNIVGWLSPEYDFVSGTLRLTEFIYGPLDLDFKAHSWYRQFQIAASGDETDILRAPFTVLVSNLNLGASNSGYTADRIGSGKLYFSTLETSSTTTDYKLYRFNVITLSSTDAIVGVYETQTQLFSKKIAVKEVRVYGEPWVTNNSFTIALIGSDGNPIAGSSLTLTAGTNLTVGDDFAWYNPQMEATFALGLRVTNAGSVTPTISKVEIDHEPSGK
mgnify:FL=1